jgi:hypothetical protein
MTRQQQILLKRAQKQAGLSDSDYREAIELVSGLPGCNSSKDPRLTNEHIDKLLSYFEAIYWKSIESGQLQGLSNGHAVFRKRHFWSTKNTHLLNSRDKYLASSANPTRQEIIVLEAELARLGFGQSYCASIRKRVTRGNEDQRGLHLYKAALRRTLAAKLNKFDLASVGTSRTATCA